MELQEEDRKMKRIGLLCAGMAVIGFAAAMAAQAKTDDQKAAKTGDTTVIAYEGSQNWPTAESAQILKDYAVPVYKGLPNKSYKVLGRIVDERAGVEEIGKAFEDTFGGQKHRIRDCANQAKLQGGDALLVTDDERILKAFNLTRKDAKEVSPLANEQHKVVLIIKF
jgi:hypothetical protein